MDAAIPSLFGRVTAVLGEHASLHTTVKNLRALCTSLATGDRAADAEFQRAVCEFLADLDVHFAAEEGDEYFGMLVSERPALKTRVDRLLAEHHDMTVLGRLISAAFTNRTPAPELAADLIRLLDILQTHERSENLLLQEFFSRDEGGG